MNSNHQEPQYTSQEYRFSYDEDNHLVYIQGSKKGPFCINAEVLEYCADDVLKNMINDFPMIDLIEKYAKDNDTTFCKAIIKLANDKSTLKGTIR